MGLYLMSKSYEVIFMPDGTNIEYTVSGTGPKVLFVHGSQRVDSELDPLIKGLSRNYTVFYMDRRGWGGVDGNSGPKGRDYSIDKECQDAMAIIKKHGIETVFGDEYGAVITLHILLRFPVKRALLLEPYLAKKRPLKWLPKMKKQVDKKKYFDAIVTYYKGEKSGVRHFPRCILKFMFKHSCFSKDREKQIINGAVVWENKGMRRVKTDLESDDWKRRKTMLTELPREIYAAKEAEEELINLSTVKTRVRFLYEDSSADYIKESIASLATLLPNMDVIRVYSGAENPLVKDNAKTMKVSDAITGFLEEG